MTHRHRWGITRELLRPATWPALSPTGRRALTEGTATVRVQVCLSGCGAEREQLVARRPNVTRLLGAATEQPATRRPSARRLRAAEREAHQ